MTGEVEEHKKSGFAFPVAIHTAGRDMGALTLHTGVRNRHI